MIIKTKFGYTIMGIPYTFSEIIDYLVKEKGYIEKGGNEFDRFNGWETTLHLVKSDSEPLTEENQAEYIISKEFSSRPTLKDLMNLLK